MGPLRPPGVTVPARGRSGPGCGRAGAPALATGSLGGRPEPELAGPDLSRWPFGMSFDDLDVGAWNLCRPLAGASASPAGCRGAPGPHSPPPLPGPAPLPAPGPVLPPSIPLSLDTKRGGHLAGRLPALGLPRCCSAHLSGQRASGGSFPGSGPAWRPQRLCTSRPARSGLRPEFVCDCPPRSGQCPLPPSTPPAPAPAPRLLLSRCWTAPFLPEKLGHWVGLCSYCVPAALLLELGWVTGLGRRSSWGMETWGGPEFPPCTPGAGRWQV